MDSRQVAWLTVLEFVQRRGVDPVTAMVAGSPRWNMLPDDHPDKIGAVLAAGVHHALRVDLSQAAIADASREIASAADWSQVGRQRPASYIPREVA